MYFFITVDPQIPDYELLIATFDVALRISKVPGSSAGVLDVDSDRFDDFSDVDKTGLEAVAAVIGRLTLS